ncbi:hypothetical protein NLJ89_g10553 [Agrocybe chaxingu]|uniref:Uncharacterized protein n=1 Tax=Agrocybe chaxingu TaxID=84603 RepID=A0A9W8JNN4_9AGAR|nr:hypothetical protein NLJ89_g10553 [Agrocybe chaxingu]
MRSHFLRGSSYPLTRTTFLFPFAIPAGTFGAAPGASVAFIPAFTVSTSTPVEIAGEYAETLLASGG